MTGRRWAGTVLSWVATIVVVAGALMAFVSCQVEGERPNIILIITDDQRWDTVGEYMPITQARIFDEGVYFPNAYVTTPLCCPSRASILTGMYAHNHGVRTNQDELHKTTFVERLHQVRYFTGIVGSYLNSWDGSPRPEFDFWVSVSRNKISYFDPELNINGFWQKHTGYSTFILRDYALRFLRDSASKNQPFLLIFAPKAPHWPAHPAPGDENLYSDLPHHRPPNYNEHDLSDKPQWLQAEPLLDPESQARIDRLRGRQLRSLRSLDQAIGSLLDILEKQGWLDNTVVFYISDNGYLWGEHRLREKAVVYEEAIRVPFALHYPRLVPTGRVETQLVANIDIAPTIYELAGLPIPPKVDGLSLVPLLEGSGNWREEFLLEGWLGRSFWAALHTSRYVYVETEGDLAELYDLEEDPYQLQNLAYDPAYAEMVEDLRERLRRLREE